MPRIMNERMRAVNGFQNADYTAAPKKIKNKSLSVPTNIEEQQDQ